MIFEMRIVCNSADEALKVTELLAGRNNGVQIFSANQQINTPILDKTLESLAETKKELALEKKKSHKRWSEYELEYVKTHFRTMTYNEIGRTLRRSAVSVGLAVSKMISQGVRPKKAKHFKNLN